jgi:hypothetical protein
MGYSYGYADLGYFVASPEGLLWFPPAGYEDRKPKLIPWSEVLDEDDEDKGRQDSNDKG